MSSFVNAILSMLLVALLCMVDAISSISDRTSIVRRHQDDRHLDDEDFFTEVDIGQSGSLQLVDADRNTSETGEGNETDLVHDHDDYPAPGTIGPDEEWNETDSLEDTNFFNESTTTEEPLTFQQLMNMPHGAKKHYEKDNSTDEQICFPTADIRVNDTRNTKWNRAGVSSFEHGEGRKYKDSCVFHLGEFPDGRVEECAEAVASDPSCKEDFYVDTADYSCACLSVDRWKNPNCSYIEVNTSCVYQINPGEYDHETWSDDDDDDAASNLQMIQEWNKAEQF